MAREQNFYFGVQAIVPYNRTNNQPYGFAKVVGKADFNLAGELVKHRGGSNRYNLAVEDGFIESTASIGIKEYPDWAYNLFLGKTPSVVDVSSAAVDNLRGSSDLNALISGVEISSINGANVKFGSWTIRVVDPATPSIDVYALGDVDQNRGMPFSYANDGSLKINSAPIALSDAAVEIAELGLTLTVTTTAPAPDISSFLSFETFPQGRYARKVRIGGENDVYPEFGLKIFAQQRGNGEMVFLDVFRCKALGMPHPFSEKAFSEAELTLEAFIDEDKDGIFDLLHFKPN